MKPLLSTFANARHFLRRWASEGTWLALAVLGLVALWGWIDPFGLRQRLDWMVADQFYRHRTPPAVHPDLLQVSIDDRAAEDLGFPIPRYYYARALRQLHGLGARAVLMDVLFTDPKNELALPEADRRLIPPTAAVQNEQLRLKLTEDAVFADALAVVDRSVLAFYLPEPYRSSPRDDKIVQAMSERLAGNLSLAPREIADQLNLPP